MKDMFKFAFVLGLVTAAAAAALGIVNRITRPRIEAQQKLALNEGLYAVLPGSQNGCIIKWRMEETGVVYTGYAEPDTTGLIGYALPVESKGYSSTIRTLVGLDSSRRIIALEVLLQQETPGLGTKCEEIRPGESEPWFQKQFEGVSVSQIALEQDGGKIDAITGATITSAAITNGVRKAADNLFRTMNASSQTSRSGGV